MQPRIIAFAKDWDDVPTCITHTLRHMARTMPVLWVNSIGTRKPRFANPRDMSRVVKRAASLFRRAERKENNLRVVSPILVPGARSRIARAINRVLFRMQVSWELKDMGDGPVEYWCAVPNAVDLLPPLTINHQPSTIIYYCVDDWSGFEELDGEWLAAKEREMLKRADVVFTPSRYLQEKCVSVRSSMRHSPFTIHDSPPIRHVPHGVDYEKFARALDRDTEIPDDIAGLRRPVIGFYGNICPWIDFGLVDQLARRCPDWNFVMIGQVYCDVSRFGSLGNVRFLGRREHDILPAYCKAFDAAMIPYDMRNPRIDSINPVKLNELLAAGVPVVASPLPELGGVCGSECGTGRSLSRAEPVSRANSAVALCQTIDEWIEALRSQIGRTDRKAISDSVRGEDWSEKVQQMRRIVESRRQRK